MTREHAKQILPIIEAFAEGKTIQHRGIPGTAWSDLTNPGFSEDVGNYRIKPEPEIRYHYKYRALYDHNDTRISTTYFQSAEEAEAHGKKVRRERFIRVIKFVEVE